MVGKFVEFFGKGLDGLSLANRATISNMCPEFGATAALFPVDDATLGYMRTTGRPAAVRPTSNTSSPTKRASGVQPKPVIRSRMNSMWGAAKNSSANRPRWKA